MAQPLPILVLIASLLLGDSPAIHPLSPAPARLPVAGTQPARHFTAGTEEPALYDLLAAIQGMPGPTGDSAGNLDRPAILAEPDRFAGALLATDAAWLETQALQLVSNPETVPTVIWSTLALDLTSREPVQILTLSRPERQSVLAEVRLVGYFYKIRQDQAQQPDASGRRQTVQVPVLVGWVLPAGTTPAQPAQAPRTAVPPWWTWAVIAGVLFVAFLVVTSAARRRTNWRSRVDQRPTWRRRRDQWRNQKTDGSQNHDQQ